MIDGQPRAIQLQGITHNTTKIGVQDGQSEDLVNLRFKDGSWRAAGKGAIAFHLRSSETQLFIHTNVYRHLLGVVNTGTRDIDGKTYNVGTLYWIANIDADGNISQPAYEQPITEVVGKITITQVGHLVSIMDEEGGIKYFFFKPVEKEYSYVKYNSQFDKYSTECFPFRKLKFGYSSGKTYNEIVDATREFVGTAFVTMADKAHKENHFYGTFLACAAVRMYDGTISFATPPIIIRPKDDPFGYQIDQDGKASVTLNSFDLCMRIGDNSLLKDNKDIITSVCVFVTPDLSDYKLNPESFSESSFEADAQLGQGSLAPDKYSTSNLKELTMRGLFYLLKEYKVGSLPKEDEYVTIDLGGVDEVGVLSNIEHQERLTYEAFDRAVISPSCCYNYNGRLHFANYSKSPYFGYPINDFCFQNLKIQRPDTAGSGSFDKIKTYVTSQGDEVFSLWPQNQDIDADHLQDGRGYSFITINTDRGKQTVLSIMPHVTDAELSSMTLLSGLITFPDYRAENIHIVHFRKGRSEETGALEDVFCEYDLPLTPHRFYNFAYHITDAAWYTAYTAMTSDTSIIDNKPTPNVYIERFPNGLKVSKTDNPMYFPVENTYQVGSAEIVALCSNAIAVGTGQTGAAPLYVFCKDGVYALFVDTTGEMTYTNARVIARDVCNNAKSVTPIDAGVVFTTDRGLMMIAGDQVEEIGQPLEGDWCKFTKEDDKDYSKHPAAAYEKVAELPANSVTRDEFLQYLTGAIVNYNHNERELMVSNPEYEYTYILDRYGNWSRRDYRADEYVNNYPTSYRLQDREMYQVDKDSDEDNSIFVMSNVIKIDSIGFKELNRVVARGYFETCNECYLRILVQGSYDGRKWVTLGHNTKRGKFRDMGCLVERTDCRFFRFVLAGKITKDSRFDYFEVSSKKSKLGAKIR